MNKLDMEKVILEQLKDAPNTELPAGVLERLVLKQVRDIYKEAIQELRGLDLIESSYFGYSQYWKLRKQNNE